MSDLDDQLLAALLAEAPGEDALETTTITPRPDNGPAPLSFAQQRLWFLHRFDPAGTAYNLTRAYRLSGNLDTDALDHAFQALIKRHAILRTRFDEQDGDVRQIVLSAPATQLEHDDLSSLPDAQRRTVLEQKLREAAARPFDLTSAPPLRAVLIRMSADEQVLLTSMHHILSDGLSNPILARDLMTAYGSAVETDSVPTLSALPIQYADFAVWQRNWLTGERYERELSYWMSYLGNDLPALDLPTDRPRQDSRSQHGSRERFTLPQSMATDLRAFCQTQNCTPFVALLAAWQLLLGRYSGQCDFAVGVPNAGRPHDELNDLVGFFVNTQVYRADLNPATTVSALCTRLRDEVRAALDHAALPFELLLDRLASTRDPGRSPVFQTLFNLQVPSTTGLTFPGLSVEPLQVEETTAKFDISLDVFYPDARSTDSIRCEIEFATELFDSATIAQMGRHFQRIVTGMLDSPDSRIDALAMLDEGERREKLERWNNSAAKLNPGEDMLTLFERRVQTSSDSIAAVFDDAQLTYDELNRRANQLGRWLISRGIDRDVLVGMCLPRVSDLLIALLAIQKAGGAHLPIDPDQPALRNAHILKHAAPAFVLTCDTTHAVVRNAATAISLEAIRPDVEKLDDQNLERPFHPRQLAYTLYTSGSTGVPKGVQIDRQAFVNFLKAMQDQLRLIPDDRLLAVTTLGFDIAGLELFLPLVTGACTVVASRTQAQDPSALLKLLDTHAITVLQATPATWLMLVEQAEAKESLAELPQTRWNGLLALCGGETLGADLATKLLNRGVRLLNVYGPTETTIWSSSWPVTSVDAPVLPIGHPIANNRLYVLDNTLEPVPAGVTGDLYIGGIGLARGYSRLPALTAAAFVPNPFADETAPGSGSGSRLYRTGDLARRRSDGIIEFLGRSDQQLKIRGFRIEPGEVEAVLESHPAVRQAVVTAHQSPGHETILCAYFAADLDGCSDDSNAAVIPKTLSDYLRERLPVYMIPAAMIPLDRLPLNANGKVDRKALPAPEFTTSERFEPPEGDTEIQLAAIWQEVLATSDISLGDDFFLLGGHSLHLVRIQVRIRAAFDCDIPLADLFRAPVLRDMAARVERALGRNDDDDMNFMAELLETL